MGALTRAGIKGLLCALTALCCAGARSDTPDQQLSDLIWDAIKVFEGDARSVTGDFDCQGISIGVAQWNVGMSFASVKKIVLSVPADQRKARMPEHGPGLDKALDGGKQATMDYVRSLQAYADPASCEAKKRKAQWTNAGKVFRRELASVLGTQESRAMQRQLRTGLFNNGRANAILWARALRGSGAEPSLKEIAYFVDMQNFNGGGLAKFGLSYAPLGTADRQACASAAIGYLRTADDAFLLHKKAARRNADLLKPDTLGESERDLFCIAHKVALKLMAGHAIQFRLTTINRRSAILFGKAYYADTDTEPTSIAFPAP